MIHLCLLSYLSCKTKRKLTWTTQAIWQALANFLRDRAILMIRGAPGSAARMWWDGTGLSLYTSQSNQPGGADGPNNNREGSMPDSGYSDWTNLGGPWKNVDSGSGQQPQSGIEDGQDEVAAEEDGKMVYLCENSNPNSLAPASKGSTAPGVGPDPIDCEKLSWTGLPGSSNPTSLLTLENPSISSNSSIGKPLLFTYGTCTLAVFATDSQFLTPSHTSSQAPSPRPTTLATNPTQKVTTISWTHILAAFETLTNLCVANPLYPQRSRGGFAYWSQQGQSVGSWIQGKRRKRSLGRIRLVREEGKRRKGRQGGGGGWWRIGSTWKKDEEALVTGAKLGRRDGVDGVDGATALPKGVNVTIFKTGSEMVPAVLESWLQCESVDNDGQGQGAKNVSSCYGG